MCVVQLNQKIKIVSNESIFFAQKRVLKRGKKIVLSQLKIVCLRLKKKTDTRGIRDVMQRLFSKELLRVNMMSQNFMKVIHIHFSHLEENNIKIGKE